ncbi:ATP-binding cassette domain-containing protein [Lactobacillus sp. S2-2]|uniref:ATP-binding cassette domain-containing protein n=1 Tax=Lactobacillus sp. S2-2 TaxID=2692917 RepID=UPI00351D958A
MPILNNINFKIKEGDRIALLGSNGAGKSTLIKIIIGLIQQTDGEIIRKINSNTDINYLSQENILIEDLTVLEQVKIEAEIMKIKSNQLLNEMLMKFSLDYKRNTIINNLSGGEKRRLSLLLCTLREAKLLILDEPTVGMDLKLIDYLWNYLYKLGSTVLTITHDFNQIDKYFSRIWLLKNGQLIKDVSVEEIHQHNQAIEQWYRKFNDGDEQIND